MIQEEKTALNQAVTELAGWRKADDDGWHWHPPTCPCTSMAPEDECTCLPCCYDFDGDAVPFTDDWRAAGMLLEMMASDQLCPLADLLESLHHQVFTGEELREEITLAAQLWLEARKA